MGPTYGLPDLPPITYKTATRLAAALGLELVDGKPAVLGGTGAAILFPTRINPSTGVVVSVNGDKIRTARDYVDAISRLPNEATVTYHGEPPRILPTPGMLDEQHLPLSTSVITFLANIRDDGIRIFRPPYREADTGASSMLAQALAAASTRDHHARRLHLAAASGVLDEFGRVYPVTGIRQKVFAARSAGARIMFVPAGNAKEALSTPHASMDIVPVRTLREAYAAWRAR